MMAGINTISEDDMELVFKAISMNENEIKWRNFYSFFDGKQLTSRRHKASLSSQLHLPNFASTKANLGTLNEEQQDHDHDNGMPDILIGDEKEKELEDNSEAKYIQKVKQTIRECLNLGEDSYLLSGSTPYTPASSANTPTFSASQNSSTSMTGIDIETIDVSQSLLRLEHCEDLLDLMEHNLYQCPDQLTMTQWGNRYQSHKIT
eukprot:UN08532